MRFAICATTLIPSVHASAPNTSAGIATLICVSRLAASYVQLLHKQ